MKQFKWQKQKPTKGFAYPTAREGASLTYVSQPHNLLVLFGGIASGRLNDTMIFDFNQQLWRSQETKGRQPAPRCYHVAFYDDKSECIFYYGGQGDKGRSLSDFYVLNVLNWSWKRLFLLEMPQSRHNHTVTDIGNQEREKIIFGGACLPENLLHNDVWIFNYSQVTLQSSVAEIPGAQCTLKQTKGEIPQGRKGHGAVIFKSSLFIYGGKTNETIENHTHLYELNLQTFVWRKVLTIGKAPSSRSFFSFSMFGADRIFLFGGIDNATNKVLNESYILQLKDLYWSAPFTAGNMPTPRYHHAACLMDKPEQPTVALIGGLDQTFQAMDLYYFTEATTSQSIQWEQIKEPTVMEQKTSQTAGSNIMEGQSYLLNLEEAMIQERRKASEMKKELDAVLQEAENLENFCAKQMAEAELKLKQADQNCKNKQLAIETIFLMIKQEQMISKEIQNKSKLLEVALQKVHDYMVVLDQFYQSIRRNKLDENDPKEGKLKKLSDVFLDEYTKAKENHRDTLFQLKQVYDKFGSLNQRVENDLKQKRQNIYEVNKEYEALIFDTEADQ